MYRIRDPSSLPVFESVPSHVPVPESVPEPMSQRANEPVSEPVLEPVSEPELFTEGGGALCFMTSPYST